MKIHPTAIVHPTAKFAEGVEIGPFCVIGPNVSIAEGTKLHNNVTILGNTTIGKGNELYPNVVIGGAPQDIKFKGDDTTVEVGNENVLREFVTIHRGTHKSNGKTVIGSHNYIMAYCHIAHDCELGDHIIMANGVQLGGHVAAQSYSNFGGLAAVHHFTTIGRLAFIGGLTRIVRDAPPFMTTEGNPAKVRCVNQVGCTRAGLPQDTILVLKEAHRILFRSKRPLSEALAELTASYGNIPEIGYLVNFLKTTTKGKQGRAREAMRRENA